MCYSDNKPYTQTWKHTLKKGSYSPDQLASLLTLAMAEVSKDKAIDFLESNSKDSIFCFMVYDSAKSLKEWSNF